MDSRRLQRLAGTAAVLMALLLVLLQFVLTPARRAPAFLFLPFTALWVFGAVMLWVAPRFGAVGTTLWGLISAVAIARTHLQDPEDYVLIAGSLAGAALAGAFLASLLRERRTLDS